MLFRRFRIQSSRTVPDSKIDPLITKSWFLIMTHPDKITYHPSKINQEQKEKKNGHQSAVFWFTGLSGSGKSTLAHAVEEKLHLKW